jgi:P-type Cu2+ transporter
VTTAAALLDDAAAAARLTRAQGNAGQGNAGPLPSVLDTLGGPDAKRQVWGLSQDDGAIAESSLQLSGLHCAACSGLIEAALLAVPGVVAAEVNAAASRATVRWQPARTQASALLAAVRAAGYDALPDTAAAARTLRRAEQRQLLWRLFVAVFCAMQVMMLATPVYVADAGTLAPDLEQLLHRSAWTLTLPVLLFSATPFFTSAFKALRSRRLGMDVPVALGIAVAFVASSGAAFDPGGVFGREVYFDSLTMFTSFLLAGRWLELRARHRAVDAIEQLALAPARLAWRLGADGQVEAVSAQRLLPGDRVRVPIGEAFPADGAIEQGLTRVDESLLSGESRPVHKRVGDDAVAGSVNLGAPVVQRVDRVGADTRYEQIAALMREALTRRPESVRVADRIAGPFLAAVLLLALGAALVWWQIDPSRALWVAVSVLIVTCPCALSLAAPSALLAATSALARRGVLLRRVEALETLARVRHVMLDKTGTLTEAQPSLRSVRVIDDGGHGVDTSALVARAAALAAWSAHPLSRALAAAHAATPAPPWHDVREVPGCGIEARDAQGGVWRLGSAHWLGAGEGAGLCFGRTAGPLLAFDFDETLADGTAPAVQALQRSGASVTLLSGDTPERVQRLADRLDIASVIAAATPERKLAALGEHQARGEVVAMVGDGVNDAPVLAQADVSFAVAHGAQIARGSADAVLLSGRIGEVANAVQLARRTVRVMRQNLAWAALYNAACVPLALTGYLPPWAAGLGMAASSVFVVLNAMRLSR